MQCEVEAERVACECVQSRCTLHFLVFASSPSSLLAPSPLLSPVDLLLVWSSPRSGWVWKGTCM